MRKELGLLIIALVFGIAGVVGVLVGTMAITGCGGGGYTPPAAPDSTATDDDDYTNPTQVMKSDRVFVSILIDGSMVLVRPLREGEAEMDPMDILPVEWRGRVYLMQPGEIKVVVR